MTAASIGRFAGKALVGLLVVCAVLSMAGCRREESPDSPPQMIALDYFEDKDTGCQYAGWIGVKAVALVPRIAADGKTHMGCKGIAK